MRDYKNSGVRNSRTVLLKQMRKKVVRREQKRKTFRRLLRALIRSLLMGASVAGAGVGIYFLLTAPVFTVKQIVFEGNVRLPEVRIRHYEQGLLHNIFLLDLKALRQELRGEPYIEQVLVRRELPDRVFIRIAERAPVARFRIDGQEHFVDREGVMLCEAPEDASPSLPLIEGGSREAGTARHGDLMAALVLLETVAHYGYPDLREIRAFDITQPGDVMMHPDGGGLKIRCGHGDYLEKLLRLKRVAADLAERGWPVRIIDLRFRDQVVVQTEKPVRVT